MKNLTKEKLAEYVERKSEYYEKYREKFNIKNNFFSWNWSLFFFVPWLAYRQIWDYYFGYLVISIIYSITFYYLIVDFQSVSPLWMIAAGLGALMFIIYSMLTANNKVLKRAHFAKNNPNVKGKSSWIVVLIASIVLILPVLFSMKSLYPIVKYHQDRNAIYFFPEKEENKEANIEYVLEKINEISDNNINVMGVYAQIGIISRKDLIDKVVCYDNVVLLKRVKEKGALFFESHLKNAVRCNALKSVSFLLEQGITNIGKDEKNNFNNFSKYRLVQNAIYKGNLPMAKLLLSKEKHIKGANAQVLIIDALRIPDITKKKDFIGYLLNKKIDIYNTLETNETSALYEAIANNDYNITKLLLEQGANPNQEYEYGKTPLSTSINNRYSKITQLLLKHHADVNKPVTGGTTLLGQELMYGKPEIVNLLLEHNATLDFNKFLYGFTSNRRINTVSLEYFYEKYMMPPLTNKDIISLYQKACESNSTKAIDLLLSKGYDINSRSSDSAYPYVAHVCYGWKDTRMFEYVITKGANVNVYMRGNDYGRDLLQNIISRNSENVFTKESWERLKLVVSHGANVNHQDDGNKTALMWAYAYPDVTQYLLENTYVNLRLVNDRNESLLHYNIDNPEVMQIIINKLQKDEYLLNKKDKYGNTPLHDAVEKSDEVVEMLLNTNKINTDSVNNIGYTPLANVKTTKSYELLKNTGNSISKSKAKCTIFVSNMGKKEYQKECLLVAKDVRDVNSITYFQFLGGDIDSLLKTTFDLSKKGKRAYMYVYGNVAHGYIIKKEFKKAKKSYEEFLSSGWTWNMTIEDSDKDMKKDFETMGKLYGEESKNKALKIWKEVIDEELQRRNR